MAKIALGRYGQTERVAPGEHPVRPPPDDYEEHSLRKWPRTVNLLEEARKLPVTPLSSLDPPSPGAACVAREVPAVLAPGVGRVTCVASYELDANGDGKLDRALVDCADLAATSAGDLIASEQTDFDGDGNDDLLVNVDFGANTAHGRIVSHDGVDTTVTRKLISTPGGVNHFAGYSCADGDGDGRVDVITHGWLAGPGDFDGVWDVWETELSVYVWDHKQLRHVRDLDGIGTGGPDAAQASPFSKAGCVAHGFEEVIKGLPRSTPRRCSGGRSGPHRMAGQGPTPDVGGGEVGRHAPGPGGAGPDVRRRSQGAPQNGVRDAPG